MQLVVRIFKTIEGAIHDSGATGGLLDCNDIPLQLRSFEMSGKIRNRSRWSSRSLWWGRASRIEVEDNLHTLILVDVPMIEERNDKDWYGTHPLVLLLPRRRFYCMSGDTQVLTRFMSGRVRNFFTYENQIHFCRSCTAMPLCTCIICVL